MIFKLNVPFLQKDGAKAFGARWNFAERYWYYEGDILPEGLKKWYSDPEETLHTETNHGQYAEYLTVSKVHENIKDEFRKVTFFNRIMVKGEVTNFRKPNSGNYYFSIKDESAVLHCNMWREVADRNLTFEFKNGKQVAIIGTFTFYKNGKSSLQVIKIMDMGAGMAALQYQQLKEKLEAEGLFDLKYKKSIPKYPKKVGIVTSKDGQARKDIEKVAHKRNPFVQLVLYHANVQGENAVRTIIKGIKTLDQMGLDSIIVGRGGGSDEELIAYNHEEMARTVFRAKTPIISAVGHEGNWALIDYVSDKRVATPSEAAEETVPDIMSTIKRIEMLDKSIADHMRSNLLKRFSLLDTQRAKLEGNNPVKLLKERQDKLRAVSESMRHKMHMIYENRSKRCAVLTAQLHGLSPTAKLVKGFGYITIEDKPVVSVKTVKTGDEVNIRIHDGSIVSKVIQTMETGEQQEG